METFKAATLEELASVAETIKQHVAGLPAEVATILTLRGELGAGKTAFVQCLGRRLGVSEQMVSPTFVVMKSYETTDERFATLVHMDAYRIESEAEVLPLHFAELCSSPRTLFCIEWAERIASVLPPVRTELAFVETDGMRTITMTHHGY
jgi:tRNA threonylcarbamoyladenosine biosynthesis protein TsaE